MYYQTENIQKLSSAVEMRNIALESVEEINKILLNKPMSIMFVMQTLK